MHLSQSVLRQKPLLKAVLRQKPLLNAVLRQKPFLKAVLQLAPLLKTLIKVLLARLAQMLRFALALLRRPLRCGQLLRHDLQLKLSAIHLLLRFLLCVALQVLGFRSKSHAASATQCAAA